MKSCTVKGKSRKNFEPVGQNDILAIKMAVKSFKEDAFDHWMRRRIGQEVTSNGSIFIDDFKTEEEINAEILSGRKTSQTSSGF
ncbi:hypothetical protein [Acinetobacter baumannii]|uniref:hypothetical protein n=1 Tax=Acinetobacter baumannii TaxID=470 RepID=UPI001F511DD2|nr:hypothetical protein [Acinetobacter baumannii]UNI12446.1 hypothetical protein L2M54_05880 [Acinetobacter baumannii]